MRKIMAECGRILILVTVDILRVEEGVCLRALRTRTACSRCRGSKCEPAGAAGDPIAVRYPRAFFLGFALCFPPACPVPVAVCVRGRKYELEHM